MKIAYIDHYDSFTHNLIDWIGKTSMPIELDLVPFDDDFKMKQLYLRPAPLLISPGPNSPAQVQPTVELVKYYLGKVPILGVCLGHQILGEVLGYRTQKSLYPLHGGTKEISILDYSGLFAGIASPSSVGVYHSLALVPASPRLDSHVTAVCQKGEIMAIEFSGDNKTPALGVQFHPESFLTEGMQQLRQNWLDSIVDWCSARTSTSFSLSSPDDIQDSIGYLT